MSNAANIANSISLGIIDWEGPGEDIIDAAIAADTSGAFSVYYVVNSDRSESDEARVVSFTCEDDAISLVHSIPGDGVLTPYYIGANGREIAVCHFDVSRFEVSSRA